MNTRPSNSVSEAARQRGHLVIFDDDPQLLRGFCESFAARGYSKVTGVLVPQTIDEHFVADGKVRTQALDVELERLGGKGDYTMKMRHQEDITIYTAMRGFTHGIRTKEELPALLEQLQPDYVLSDLNMRTPDMVGEEHAVMGTDIMAAVAQWRPHTPRAIHSDKFNEKNPLTFAQTEDAREQGYGLHYKDKVRFDVVRIDHDFQTAAMNGILR